MNALEMESTARALVSPGKGILAADESFPTIQKRFNIIGVASTESTRRNYREMLFTTAHLGEYISGVILFDETIRQRSATGELLVDVLKKQGIIPGIKVDKGVKRMANFANEKITEGLDGLRDRLAEYRLLGALFTKWRAVFSVGEGIPSSVCLEVNAHALARFAALSQEADLVPIVEPEVLMDGDHTLEAHFQATEAALNCVFDKLHAHHIHLEAMLLKPNMVLPGKDSAQTASVIDVAEATRTCLLRTVPAAVPGIVFLSGGQSDLLATEHLNALNQLGPSPWQLSFSFGRALQAPALTAWRGEASSVKAGQAALFLRARCNSEARFGKNSESMERMAA